MTDLNRALEKDDCYYNEKVFCRLPHDDLTEDELTELSSQVVIVKEGEKK